MKKTRKTADRKKLIDKLVEEMLYNNKKTLDYTKVDENVIITSLIPRLINLSKGQRQGIEAIKKAASNVKSKTIPENSPVISSIIGIKQSPDLAYYDESTKTSIAINILRGNKGDAMKNFLGSSVVFSLDYDFVVNIFIDLTNEKKIVDETKNNQYYKDFIKSMWENYNIKLVFL